MDSELVSKARAQHRSLMEKVEMAISKLYQVKEENEHLHIWYAVGALEVYKMQSTLLFDALISGIVATDEQRAVAGEIRDALTNQLETISDLCLPLLGGGDDNDE